MTINRAVPGGHRRVSSCQAANGAVLLRFFGLFHRWEEFRAHPDGHRQYVSGVLMQNARRRGPTGASRRVRSDKKELVRNNRPEPRF